MAKPSPPIDPIEQLLADPLIRLVMSADRVEPQRLREALRDTAGRRVALQRPVLGDAETEVSLAPDPSGPFRPGVGIVLLNAHGEVFVGRRIDHERGGWQMPQGGIEPGETPEEAARRELREEIGTDNVDVIAESRGWVRYALPPHLVGRAWNGRWRGQQQKWFAMRFLGIDSEINLETAHPEFSAWRWAPAAWVPEMIVGFKQRLYELVLGGFDTVLAGSTGRDGDASR
jgi:putative (di)nucleoside polyphosphate hydrolase